jgi:hypothetical protein
MQRPAISPGSNVRVGLFRLRECHILRERDDAAELGIELLDPVQIDVGQTLGGERLLFDPARQLGHWRKGDVGVARGQRNHLAPAAHERVVRRA